MAFELASSPGIVGSGTVQRLMLLVTVIIVLLLAAPAQAEGQMVLGPRQFESDSKGAVLCMWAIYLTIQAETAACGFERKPIDDAVDKAVAAMDEFILANSSLHPTRAMLEDFKRRAVASQLRPDFRKYCAQDDVLERFRSGSAEQFEAMIRGLLAVPREPVMNPCV